jgi:hypothetical protein
MPEFKVDMFLLGCLGGLLPDILRIIKNRNQKNTLDCFRHFTYWLSLVLQVLLGGFAVYILSTASITKALAIGFSAPEVITSLVSKKEEPLRIGEERKFKIRAWLAD